MTDPRRNSVGMKKLLRDPYVWVLVVFVVLQAALLLLAALNLAADCGDLPRQMEQGFCGKELAVGLEPTTC